MQNVILVVHILACIALTAVVLLQRSEGGALGIGGGGPGGGIMSGRGAAGALVRTTMIFAGVFFVTSLTLTTMAARDDDSRTAAERAGETTTDDGAGGLIDQNVLNPETELLPSAPVETPLDLDADPAPALDTLGETPLDLREASADDSGETPDETTDETPQ
ncbi:MAG: preprotein translocase subunit SecG [Pseudomonadota bacterium]